MILLPSACRTVPLLASTTGQFAAPNVPLAERAAQVERAAAGLGWRIVAEAPGTVEAALGRGDRQASVRISFDRTVFRIDHLASRGFARAGQRIERGFNDWVLELRAAIMAQSAF